MFVLAMAAVSLSVVSTQQIPEDGASFLEMIEKAYSPIRDISTHFQSAVRPQHPKMTIGAEDVAGTYVLCLHSNQQRLDYRASEAGSRPADSVSISDGGNVQKEVVRTHGGASGFIRKSSPADLNGPGLPSRILHLSTFSTFDTEIRESYQFHGMDQINGHDCLKVSFQQFPGLKGAEHIRHTFWIDLNRGAMPLQWEFAHGSDVHIRMKDIELIQCDGGSGTRVWVPVKGIVTTHLVRMSPKELSCTKEPAIIETIVFPKSTLRINEHPSNEVLDLEFQRGTGVKDMTEGVVYVAGGPDRPSRTLTGLSPQQAEDVLSDGINEANAQIVGLTARARPSNVWLAGVGLFAITALTVGAVIIRRKFRAS